MFYPYYSKLQSLSQNIEHGNFGLWYNKLIPLNTLENCETCGKNGKKENAVELYFSQYSSMKKGNEIKNLLVIQHLNQVKFCQSFSSQYEIISITAQLKTPLITGIGETHPHEISMVFDHNIGIPYIPATGIKGIVRFAHTLGLLNDIPEEELKPDGDGNFSFDDEKDWTNVPRIFGTQKKRGSVIFLDAYPEQVPSLHIDIMNPHYGKYYNENNVPPADYLDPNPIKFLTVEKGTIFVFRALVDKKDSAGLVEKVKTAFKESIAEEGVGAKTAVGYGVFSIVKEDEPDSILQVLREEVENEKQKAREILKKDEEIRIAGMSEDERIIEEIKKLQKDPNQIASLVNKCLGGSYQKEVYEVLKKKLEKLDEWKPEGSKKRKQKIKERNTKIEENLNT